MQHKPNHDHIIQIFFLGANSNLNQVSTQTLIAFRFFISLTLFSSFPHPSIVAGDIYFKARHYITVARLKHYLPLLSIIQ